MTLVAEILAKYNGAECKDEVVEEECTGECGITTTTGRQHEVLSVLLQTL